MAKKTREELEREYQQNKKQYSDQKTANAERAAQLQQQRAKEQAASKPAAQKTAANTAAQTAKTTAAEAYKASKTVDMRADAAKKAEAARLQQMTDAQRAAYLKQQAATPQAAQAARKELGKQDPTAAAVKEPQQRTAADAKRDLAAVQQQRKAIEQQDPQIAKRSKIKREELTPEMTRQFLREDAAADPQLTAHMAQDRVISDIEKSTMQQRTGGAADEYQYLQRQEMQLQAEAEYLQQQEEFEDQFSQIKPEMQALFLNYAHAQDNAELAMQNVGTNPRLASMLDQENAKADELYRQLRAAGYTDDQIYLYTELARRKESAEQDIEQRRLMYAFADQHPIIASGISIAAKPISGAVGLAGIVDSYRNYQRNKNAGHAELGADPNNIYLSASAAPDQIRQGVMDTNDAMIGDWDAFDYFYSIGMSTADSVVASRMPGLGGKLNLGLSDASFFANAASEEYRQQLQRGMTPEQATENAIAAGLIEVTFEHISIEQLRGFEEASPKTGKEILKNAAKAMFVNASEEGTTSLANNVYDILRNRDLSEYAEAVQLYRTQGLSEEEAQQQAKRDLAKEIASDMLAGGLQGLLMGGTGSVIGNARYNAAAKYYGGQLQGQGRSSETLAAAKAAPAGTRAATLAEQYAAKAQKENRRLTDKEVGKLAIETAEFMGEATPQGSQAGVTTAEEAEERFQQAMRSGYNADQAYAEMQDAKDKIDRGQAAQVKSVANVYEQAAARRESQAKEGRLLNDAEKADITNPRLKIDGKNSAIDGRNFDAKNQKYSEFKGIFTAEKRAIDNRPYDSENGEKRENGSPLLVKLTDGRTVTMQQAIDALPQDSLTRAVWTQAAQLGSADAANLFIEHFDGENTVELEDYRQAVADMRRLGSSGLTFDQLKDMTVNSRAMLTADAQRAFFDEAARNHTPKVGVTDLSVRPGGARYKLENKILEAIAKTGNLEFVIVDDFKNTNGEYIKGDGVIVLSRNAEGSLLTRTAGHEVFHFVQDYDAQSAKALADFVLQKLGGRDSADVRQMLQKYDAEIYKTPQAREDELVADSMFDVFNNEKTVRELTGQHAKLGRKLEGRLGQLLTGIRAQLRAWGTLKRADGSYIKPEIAALMDDVEALETIRTMLLDGLKKAGENRAASMANGTAQAGAEKNTAGAVEFKYSLADNASDEVDRVLQDILYDNEVLLRNETPPILASQPGVKDLPMVMQASHIRENILTLQEALALGLPTGPQINYHGLGKQLYLNVIDQLDNVTEAYRGTKNAANPERRENYFLLVSTLKDDDDNRINVPAYVNQIGRVNNVFIDANKIATVFGRNELREYIKREIQRGNLIRIKDKSVKASEKTPPIGLHYSNHASVQEENSTTDAESQDPKSTQDADYLAAVERGDEAEAQRVVDAAAERALADSKARGKDGMLEKVYHGTTELEQINVFHRGKRGNLGPGIYITTDQAYAKRYANAMGDGGKVYTGYIDLKNPIVCTSSEPAREILRAIYGSDTVYNRRIRTQTNAASILTQADIRKGLQKGFDGVVWDLGSKEYAVWNPEQIKSADPVTYDDAGNVIPLSERFDQTKEDFRYSIKEYGFHELSKEAKNNITQRKQIILNSEQELMNHIQNALDHPNEKQILHLGAIDSAVLKRIESDTGQKIFRKKEYSFAISYDDIRHIKEHFANSPEAIAKEIKKLYAIFKGYDTVEYLLGTAGRIKLVFNKSFTEADYRTVEIVSNKKSSINLETFFVTKNNKKESDQAIPPAATNTGSPGGDSITFQNNDTTSGGGSQGPRSTKDPVDFIAARTAAAMQENLEFRQIFAALGDYYGDSFPVEAKQWKQVALKETAKTVRGLLREYGSKYDLEEATNRLASLYEVMNNYGGEETADYTGVLEGAFMLARDILQESSYKNTELYDQFKDVRDYLKGVKLWISPTVKAEIENLYGDYNTYRSAMFGKVNGMSLSDRSGRMSMDELWQELNTLAPEYFPLDTNEGDMPGKLAWFFEATAPRIENPYNNGEADINETAAVLQRKMIEGYLDVKAKSTQDVTKRNMIWNAKQQLQAERKQMLAELRAQRQALQDYKADLRAEYREKTRTANKINYERYQQRLAQYKELRTNREEKQKEKAALVRNLRYMQRRLEKETNSDHIPEHMKPMIRAFSNLFPSENAKMKDWRQRKGFAPDDLRKVADAYRVYTDKYIKPNNSAMDPQVMLDQIDLVRASVERNAARDQSRGRVRENGTRLWELQGAEVKALRDISDHLRHLIRTENKLFADEKHRRADDTAHAVIREVDASGKVSKYQDDSSRTKVRDALKNRRNAILSGFLTPSELFRGYSSDTLYELFQNLRRGENTSATILREARDKEQTIKAQYHYDPMWRTREAMIPTREGEIDVSVEDMLEIYALSKRPQGRQHLLSDGARVFTTFELTKDGWRKAKQDRAELKEEKKRATDSEYAKNQQNETEDQKEDKPKKTKVLGRTVHFTEVELAALERRLTDEQKGYVDAMVDYITNDIGKRRNEVSMALYGIERYKEKYYIPIHVAGESIDEHFGQRQQPSNIKNQSSTKRTQDHAGNAVEIRGFTDNVNQHIYDSALYCAYTLPLEDLHKVLNFREPELGTPEDGAAGLIPREVNVASVLKTAGGVNRWNQIKKFLIDVDSGQRSTGTTPFAQFVTNAKRAAVTGNLSVVVQQPSAVGRAYDVIDQRYFSGIVKVTHAKETIEEMKRWNGCALIKEIGYFDVNMGGSAVDWIDEYKTDKDTRRLRSTGEHLRSGLETGKELVDKVGGAGAEWADEHTWATIWVAAKKMAAKKYGLEGEAMLRKAADIFQETIARTQVYDSVFNKCEYLRQKGTITSLSMAFMSEPILSMNMMAAGIQDGIKAKNFRPAARAFACYLSSLIINTAAKSFVYAIHDDDDDKSFWEKYISSAAENAVMDLIGLIPFGNIVTEMLQGYSFDRMDMTLFSEMSKTLKMINSMIDNQKFDVSKVVERLVQLLGASTGMAASTGLRTAKTIRRMSKDLYDNALSVLKEQGVRGAAEHFKDSLEPTTAAGVVNAIKDGFSWVPGVKAKNETEMLYDAFMQDDSTQAKRSTAHLLRKKTQSEIDNAIAKMLNENSDLMESIYLLTLKGEDQEAEQKVEELHAHGFNYDMITKAEEAYEKSVIDQAAEDQRAAEAAKARAAGDYSKYKNLRQKMIDEGNYSAGVIDAAIEKNKENESALPATEFGWKPKEEDKAKEADILGAIASDDSKDLDQVYQDLLRQKDTEKDAVAAMNEQIRAAYKDGAIDEDKAERLYKRYNPDKKPDEVYGWMEESKGGTKYGDFDKAISSGSGLNETIQSYLDLGIAPKTLKSRITSELKPKVLSGEIDEERAIDAFMALDDSYADAAKKVQKWYEEE